MKNTALFVSPDKTQKLTIVLALGKRGYNVKCTVKGIGKDAPKAITGGRESFKDLPDASKAFEALKTAVTGKGWTVGVKREKNAFTIDSIPVAPGAKAKTAKSA